MKRTKIGFVTGYTGAILKLLGKATSELNEQRYPIEVQARYQAVEIDDEFWGWLKNEADAIVVNVHSSFESYDVLKQVLSGVNVPVFSVSIHFSAFLILQWWIPEHSMLIQVVV